MLKVLKALKASLHSRYIFSGAITRQEKASDRTDPPRPGFEHPTAAPDTTVRHAQPWLAIPLLGWIESNG